MALGIATENTGGGDFLPILKYDSRSGRFFRPDRSQDANGNWQSEVVDITGNVAFLLDFATIEVGWINFSAGSAPDFRMVAIGQPLPAKPGELYKQGFRARVKLGKSCGGDVREWAGTAKVILGQVDALHTAYTIAPESKAGKLPVVMCNGTVPVKSGSGTKSSLNYAPLLYIASWVDRPADLPLVKGNGNGAQKPATASPAQATAQPANHVPPPVQQAPAPSPAAAVGGEF